MKKISLLMLSLLLFAGIFAACSPVDAISENSSVLPVQAEESTDETLLENTPGQPEESTDESGPTPASTPASAPAPAGEDLAAEEIFEVVSMPLYMEGTLTDNETTVDAYLYLTDQHLRIEMHDYDFVPIAVFNLEDDSAFMYCDSKKLGIAFDEFEIYEFLHYQDFIDENAAFVENMQETTMNGYDVVYGEVAYEGDVMKFWYSCEYDVPIRIELTTVEGDYSAMDVTKVEKLEDADPKLFKKPNTVMFINLDDEDLDMEDLVEYME